MAPARRHTIPGPGEPGLVLGTAVVASWALWSWLDGGFSITVWAPVGMGLVVLLALGLVYGRAEIARASGLRAVVLVSFGAFALWNFASMAWADFPADAWADANKTLLYVLTMIVFAFWPFRPPAVRTILTIFV